MTAPEGVIEGNNLDVLTAIPDHSIDLIYIDPPFGTGKAQTMKRIATGKGDQTRLGYGGKSYNFEEVSRLSYADNMPFDRYLEFLHVRLVEMHRVLTPSGSLYLHLDYRTTHYARFMLDEIFGADHFLNEIIWSYDYGGRHRDRWPRKHDSILWYAKGSTWTFNRDEIDRIPYMAPGLVTPEKAERGKLPTDVWWMTIVPTNSRERTGYPTQKPVKLVERIIRASSDEGELVADFFCGSGTTGVAARNTNRRYLLTDENPEAIAITKKRLDLV